VPTIKNLGKSKVPSYTRGFTHKRAAKEEQYHTTRWRNLSKLFRSQNPLCVSCLSNHLVVAAQHVDHIRPISEGGAMWNIENLQSLCISCHNRKSAKERIKEAKE
jgi:5-methylcytosine-specific restriction protein A